MERERHQIKSLCVQSLRQRVRVRVVEQGRSGAEAGGGDACLEVWKVRRGCIVDDGSVLLMMGAYC